MEPSSRSLVSLSAAMQILYLASSYSMSAVRRRAHSQVSCNVLTFKLAATSCLCFIEKFILCFFRPHVGYVHVDAEGYPGNVEQAMVVKATVSRPFHHWW